MDYLAQPTKPYLSPYRMMFLVLFLAFNPFFMAPSHELSCISNHLDICVHRDFRSDRINLIHLFQQNLLHPMKQGENSQSL